MMKNKPKCKKKKITRWYSPKRERNNGKKNDFYRVEDIKPETH